MAIRVPLRACVGLAVAAVLAAWAFVGVAHAAPPEPDRVSLSEQTVLWAAVRYAGGSGGKVPLTIGTAQGNALISAETNIK